MADAEPHPPLDYVQRLELLRIESSAGVEPGSVKIGKDEDGRDHIVLDLRTEPTVETPAADIRDVERVHFIYGKDRRFGEASPYWIMCDRDDFPREVGHLCSGPPGGPAVPCLALGGMQPLYERGGIELIMERLRCFMRDAKTGTLMADGWEPVPFPVDQKFRGGEIEPHRFQDHAAASPAGGYAVGAAIHIGHEGGEFVLLHPEVIPFDQLGSFIGERNGEGRSEGYMAVPWVFLWPAIENVETAPIFESWRTQAELREGLKRIGVVESYDSALGRMRLMDVNFKVKRPPIGGKSFAVIVGIWRPFPIEKAFFGYSDDPVARALELRAYLVSQDGMGDIVADEARVEAIVGSYPPRPELLRWVSGIEEVRPFSLFGAGALGSAVFENLVRAGANDAFVQDTDILGSHNLARHSGRLADVHKPKTDHVDKLIRTIVQDGSTSIETSTEDVASMDIDVLKMRIEGRLVIDATADERVRLRMDELRLASAETIIRSEMFHEGRLGTTFVTVAGGPTPSELMLSLIAAAVEDKAVAAWLEYEMRHPLGPDPMLYGFGCTSQTVHLPNYVVEQQAAVAVTAILNPQDGSGVLINPLDEHYRPLGYRWLPVTNFKSLTPPTEKKWTIRVSEEALQRMRDDRARALPNETGGYLYGNWDPARRAMTVVAATSLPPGSLADSKTLDLGPAGKTPEEQRLIRKSRGRIYLCGTWHSHSGVSARMSSRDHKAISKHQERDASALRPTLMIIVADGDVQAHLQVP
jgi:hypothetical protein